MKRAPRFFRLNSIRRTLPIIAIATALFCAPRLFAQESIFTPDPSKSTIEFTLGASLHTVHGTFKLKRGEIHFDGPTADLMARDDLLRPVFLGTAATGLS